MGLNIKSPRRPLTQPQPGLQRTVGASEGEGKGGKVVLSRGHSLGESRPARSTWQARGPGGRSGKDLCLYPQKATPGCKTPPLGGEGRREQRLQGTWAKERKLRRSGLRPRPLAEVSGLTPRPQLAEGLWDARDGTLPPSLVGPSRGHMTQSGQSPRLRDPCPLFPSPARLIVPRGSRRDTGRQGATKGNLSRRDAVVEAPGLPGSSDFRDGRAAKFGDLSMACAVAEAAPRLTSPGQWTLLVWPGA
nr:uncharacterized protein LOC129136934 [Pan troglodytes]